jgi:subtilisin-like proprotein convertase family protein
MNPLFKSLLSTFLVLISYQSFSQLDTDHYFPPLFGREDQGTHYLVLSTHSSIPFDVTVTDGSGTLITTLTISNASSTTYMFGSGTTSPLLVTEAELNDTMSGKGLILSGQYPFYATVRVVAGAQATAMTSKGQKAALGTDFRTGHLFQNTGEAFRKSNVFGIMATEDNTTITIDDIRPGVIFRGTTPSGAPLTSPSVTITLDAGESYVVAAFLDQAGATQNVNGVNGTHVTSDKPIVMTTGSWLGGNPIVGGSPSTGRDIGTDQIVPIDVIGNEYVIIKGEGIDNEKVIVVAAYDNTDVMINGNPVPVATINAGDYYVIDGLTFSTFDNLYLEASKDVYVYQTTNGGNGVTDDNERQNDMIFLPPVGCTGSKNVVLPNVNWVGTAYINIIANAGANVYVNGTPLGAGDVVTGTADYVTYKLTAGYTGDVTITSDDLIRVALINLSGNIGAACYFSGFTKDIVVQTQTINGDNIALEGCIPASFTFSLDSPSDEDTEINYNVAGTANNGVDYGHIDNTLTIPAGQLSATVFINSVSDGIPEGQESIYIIYQPDACSPVDTAFLFIDDAQPIEFTIDGTNLDCYDDNTGEILVNATGGFPTYTYHVTTNGGTGTTATYTTNPITGLAAGTYSVQVYDIYGCKADALVIGGVFDADTTFLPDGTGVSYTTTININGFGAGELLDDMSQLQQICATMEHSYLGDLQIKVISPSGQEVILKEFSGGGSCDLGEPFASGPVDGANSTLTDPGIGYEYCWNDAPVFGTMVAESGNFTHTIPASTGGTYTDTYLPQGSYTPFGNLNSLLGSTLDGDWVLEVSDQFGLDNGYIFNWNISLVSDLPDTLVTLNQPTETDISGFITQAQCGTNDGAINISVAGDYPPYTFLWSNGATTEDLSAIGAGTYEVFVTNANGCTDSAEFILNNISSLNISTSITSVTCAGGNNGAIAITTSGGTAPYTYSWSNGAVIEDLSSITANTYTVTITDDNGCIYSEDLVVNTLPSMVIVANNVTNEACGTSNGSIDISVSGGSGSYGYSWSNGMMTQDISSLTAGVYSIDVTDGFGCVASQNITLINDVSNCSSYCYLDAAVNSITDEICGNGTGAIDIDVVDATQPYTVLWSTGSTNEDLSNLSAGTYTITINDANQCEHIETFTVGNTTSGLGISASSVSDENCGNGMGAIDISISGGTLPYAYSWSTGATSQDLTNLTSASYSVTVTDGNGCQFAQSFSITNNTGFLAYSTLVTNEFCNNNNGNINLTVTGASGSLTYSWSNGATTQDINGLNPGTFTCTITDQTGCELVTAPITVSNNSGTLDILSTIIINESCGDGQGAIDLSILGGTTPYTFDWSNGSTSEDLTGLSAGNYSCTITDDNGCFVSTGSITVWNSPGTLAVTTDYIVDELCGNALGAIYVETTGGTTPYSFSWNNGSVNEDNLGLVAGNYSLTVTDANGCTLNLNESVSNSAGTLQIDNAVLTHESCGNTNGAINLIASGGTPGYTYSWSSGPITQDLNALAAGTYSVVVTDANGCQVNDSYLINNNAGTLAVSHISTAELCSNGAGSINLTVTGGTAPYTYVWSNSSFTEDLSGLSAGTYSCEITDASSCAITSASIVIGNNPGTLSVTENTTDESCGASNGAIDLTVTGGDGIYSYTWSNSATTQDISGLAAATYTYLVSDGNGCEIAGSSTLINTSGSFTFTAAVSDELCNNNNGAINLTTAGGTAPFSFAWSNAAVSEDLTALNQGLYSCVVTDANGCEVSTGNLTVSNNPGTLNLNNIVVTNENCGNGIGAIDITISGGTTPYAYLWSNAATTADLILLSEGNYSCTVTDAAGCSLAFSTTVNDDPGNLQIFAQTITNESCGNNNGAINITMAGGTPAYTYVWSNGATTQDINSLSEGTYSLFVNDAGGCSFSTDFSIINSGGNMMISGSIIGNEICGNAAGSIDITVVDGTAPFLFNWSNGSISEDISGLIAGTYSVTITDVNGCATNDSFTVGSNNGTLVLVSSNVTDENCGDAQGSIDITVTGGTAPITYDWSSGSTTQDLSGLSAGTYSVTVEDQFGCNVSTTETISNITGGFSAVVTSVTDEVCGDGTGAIDITVTGGTSPYTYDWSSGATSEDLSGLAAGVYDVIITDGAGCSTTISETVNNNTGTLAISNSVLQDANCISPSGFIDLTISGGTPGYDYLWSNSATTQDIAGLAAGTYTCVITDNAGCVLNYTGTITNGSGIIATDVVIADAMCGNDNGSIEVTVTSGISPFNFSWTGAAPTICCDYTLEIIDLFGDGWDGATIEVFVNSASVGLFSPAGNGATETIAICDGDLIELDYTAGAWEEEHVFTLYDSQGGVVYTDGPNPATGLVYSGTTACSGGGPNITAVSDLAPGTYDLTITDDVGCSLTETYTVIEGLNDLQLNLTSLTDDQCLQGSGQVVYTVSGGTAPFDVTLNGVPDGGTPGQFSNEAAGNYDLVVWDAGGCTDTLNLTIGNTTTFTTTVVSVLDETCGQANGSIDLDFAGAGFLNITWSNGETTEDITGLVAGTYVVDIIDFGSFCQDQQTFTIHNSADITVTGAAADEFCNDNAGSIDLTVTGSTDLDFDWSNGATTEDLTALSEGTYTCTVTNNITGCQVIVTYDIFNVTTGITATAFVTDDFCGEGSGAIDLVPTGGSGNYSFDWSNSSTTEDLNGIGQGDYTVTVTDIADGCLFVLNATVGNNTSYFVIETITDAACATCTEGAIDLTIIAFPADDPYTYLWSNGATTEDISGLTPGTYTVTITSASGCTSIITYVVGNSNSASLNENEGGISLSIYPNPAYAELNLIYNFYSVDDVNMFMTNAVGEIVLTKNLIGHTGSQMIDISQLSRGVYFVHVTDGNTTRTLKVIVARK